MSARRFFACAVVIAFLLHGDCTTAAAHPMAPRPTPQFGQYQPPPQPYQPNGSVYTNKPGQTGFGNAGSSSNQSHIAPDAVTPEQAQKLYNRPKTNPPPKFDPKSSWPRIAGEFEKQNAIMISLSELLPQHGSVFRRIAELTENHVPLVVLFNDSKQVLEAIKVLKGSESSFAHLRFMQLELDTVWLRDFGPLLAQLEDRSVMSIDFFYNGQRPVDDNFPRTWATMTKAQHNSVPWTIQGGNLLVNGIGLALTTSRVFDDNKVVFPPKPGVDVRQEQREFVLRQFKEYTNLKHISVLQPLQNEKTRHVDMFATFANPKEVIVAQLDPRLDPINARILDQNARQLQGIKIDGEPLKVHRIPVPVRRGTSWSPYTNVIIANKLLMMPVMNTDDRSTIRRAIEVYRRVLPDHRIATVDISSMAKLEGALHCMSIHVPHYVDLPEEKMISYGRAIKWAQSQSK
jgi:agmatine/peptidylarginine deiminase